MPTFEYHVKVHVKWHRESARRVVTGAVFAKREEAERYQAHASWLKLYSELTPRQITDYADLSEELLKLEKLAKTHKVHPAQKEY